MLKVTLKKEKACLRFKTFQSRKQREKKKFRKQYFNYQKYGPRVFQKHPNTNTLTVSDVEDFWRGIVGVEGSYNLEDPAVKKWRTKTANIALDVDDFVLSNDRWKRVLNKTRAWKALGPDGICAFWYKKLPKVSEILKVFPREQRVLRKIHRGCLDGLMIDLMASVDAMLRHKNLSVAWVDYQKAYDRAPHG